MKTDNAALKTRDTRVMAGIDKHIAASITIAGTPYTHANLKTVFQSRITVHDKTHVRPRRRPPARLRWAHRADIRARGVVLEQLGYAGPTGSPQGGGAEEEPSLSARNAAMMVSDLSAASRLPTFD